MNPVPIMKLVELAKGQHTSQQTFESCKGLAEFMGKDVATSQDRPVSAVADWQQHGVQVYTELNKRLNAWVIDRVFCSFVTQPLRLSGLSALHVP